jgi:hypothetical protein
VAAGPVDSEWKVSGTISDIRPGGALFMMTTDKKPERVYVVAALLEPFVTPAVADKMQRKVTRNEHGLLATKVLRIEKPISV